MKNKTEFIEMLTTLLYSWGGDTPPKAIWTANDLLDWLTIEYGIKIPDSFHETTFNEDDDSYEKNEVLKLGERVREEKGTCQNKRERTNYYLDLSTEN